MNVRLLYVLIFLTFGRLQASELTLSGTYQGKNLYVQNPFTSNMKDFCTDEVFINEVKVMSNIQSSAFEIDLSHLKLNEAINIKITHKTDCSPKILNPQVIRMSSNFGYNSFFVNADHISWATKGEKNPGKYFLEHFVNNSWANVKELAGRESAILNTYDVPSNHHSGVNKYRVKYVEHDGQVFYSQVAEFVSILKPVEYYPKRILDRIYLSREADFEILDAYGNSKTKGHGKEIDMKNDPSGVYYLNVDNKTIKVYKK